MMTHTILLWTLFNLAIIVLLVIDLKVVHKGNKESTLKAAIGWSVFWVVLALLFNVGVYFFMGSEKALEFFTGYLIERALSMDNLFVFLLIFTYFNVSPQHQQRVLFLGILGALVFRAIFIIAGVTLIVKFHWLIYVFGVFLIYAGIKLLFEKEKKLEPEKNPVVRLFRHFFPVADQDHSGSFIIKQGGKWLATPLCLVLVLIETSDIIFAVDSIPAILAITQDSFIVYTSNVFAILGLRALYFVLVRMMQIFAYLNYGLAAILTFVGVKMVTADILHISTGAALGVVAGVLAVSIAASVMFPKKDA
ncbi:MAG: TerC family protein [Fibrobacterota bacterium]